MKNNIRSTEDFLEAIDGKANILLLDFDGVIITPRCVIEMQKRGVVGMDWADPLGLSFVHHWALKHKIFIMPFTTHASMGFDHCAKVLLGDEPKPTVRADIVRQLLPPLMPSNFKDEKFSKSASVKRWSPTAVDMNKRFVLVSYLMTLLGQDQKIAWLDDARPEFFIRDASSIQQKTYIWTDPQIGITLETHNTLMHKFGIDDHMVAFV